MDDNQGKEGEFCWQVMFSCVYKDYVWPADSFTNFTVEPHFRVLDRRVPLYTHFRVLK